MEDRDSEWGIERFAGGGEGFSRAPDGRAAFVAACMPQGWTTHWKRPTTLNAHFCNGVIRVGSEVSKTRKRSRCGAAAVLLEAAVCRSPAPR